MNVLFPYSFDQRGRTADADQVQSLQNRHTQDLIEQVLFTAPGERVNRPDFGCGLLQLVFAPNSSLLASATEALAAAALDRWLSDWIVVQKLEVRAVDSTLNIRLTYMRRDTREMSQLVISR